MKYTTVVGFVDAHTSGAELAIGGVLFAVCAVLAVLWIIFPLVIWSKMNDQIALLKKQVTALDELKSALKGTKQTPPSSISYKAGASE